MTILSEQVKQTLKGLKKSRKKCRECIDPEPCKTVEEEINTSLYEIILTHPDFSWLVTDPDVRASISIKDKDHSWSVHRYWSETLKMTDEKCVRININRREPC